MARRELTGCRVALTGASSGIGRELAAQLAQAGARLVLLARREALLGELAEQLRGRGAVVETVSGDVTDPAARTALLSVAKERFSGLDLLVNNAGISALGRFDQASSERLRRIMEVNFFAPVELTREALPLLSSGRQPLVVNIGSILGHRGIPQCSEYCASKFALRGWSEALRAELANSGIGVLVVSPGTTRTEFFEHVLEGGRTPWPQQPGVPPALVARRTLAAIRKGKHEIFVNSRGRLLVYLNRLWPWLVDRLMARYG
jgi:short-subunit dehydrogenase